MNPSQDDKDWVAFEEFAKKFYARCLHISVEVAGAENPSTIQILLGKMSPSLLELYEYFRSVK